jgi:hypothetical protein
MVLITLLMQVAFGGLLALVLGLTFLKYFFQHSREYPNENAENEAGIFIVGFTNSKRAFKKTSFVTQREKISRVTVSPF